ncbi:MULTISPECIES: PQQ-binding-like beta-propeller repeat protein [Candidatus Ichthyocystis]|uniref:Putative exported protein, PQQ repeat domain n=1 Tax=Candidatus Ichthyocystis hellenicum TaxID=1561003 RepID=A0A0S4M1Y4_9BURK|nr:MULTISPECIES: PQQ-binding-like beta-propeller repeat protein [Ichthyocystis]CUT17769.1 putative exported protein, PQQ repeat domain [Candidatus Ichthyocystis hellenicum]
MINRRLAVFFLHVVLLGHVVLSHAAEGKFGSITVHFRDDNDPNFDLHNKTESYPDKDKSNSSDLNAEDKFNNDKVASSKSKVDDPKSTTLSSDDHVKGGGFYVNIANLKKELLLSSNKPKVHNDLLYRSEDNKVSNVVHKKKRYSVERKFFNSPSDKSVDHVGFNWVLSWVHTVPAPNRNPISILSPDVSADGTAVVASTGGRVSAFYVSSGDKKWSVRLPNLSAGVVVDTDLCFVVSEDGKVYSLSMHDGHIVWTYNLDSTVTSLPVADNGQLIIKNIYGSVVALNRANGALLWRFSRTWSKDMVVRDPAPLTVSGPYILVPAPKGQIFILDKTNGHLKFALTLFSSQGVSDLERMTDLVGNAFYIKPNIVCAVSFLHAVGCYQLDKKIFSWVKGIRSFYGAVFDAGNIFISTEDGLVQSLYLESGNEAWTSNFLGDTFLTRPVIFKDYVLVGDRFGRLDILNSRTGALVRRLQFSRRASFVSFPRVWSDYVVILSQDGHVFCVHYVKS